MTKEMKISEMVEFTKGDWEIDIKTSGHTVRQLAGNMDGTGQLSSKSGRLSNQGRTNALFGDLLGNIVRSVNPFAEQEPYTEITCAVFQVGGCGLPGL